MRVLFLKSMESHQAWYAFCGARAGGAEAGRRGHGTVFEGARRRAGCAFAVREWTVGDGEA